MNSLDFLVVFTVTAIMAAFIKAAYTIGYRQGHGEGFVRGRAIAKALHEKGFVR